MAYWRNKLTTHLTFLANLHQYRRVTMMLQKKVEIIVVFRN